MSNRNYSSLRLLLVVITLAIWGLTLFSPVSQAKTNLTPGKIQLVITGKRKDPFFDIMFSEQETPYLPFAEITNKLELPLFKIDWQQKKVQGKITTDPNYDQVKYKFNLKTGRLQNKNGSFKAAPADYIIKDKQVYIKYSLLADWLPVEVNWDAVYYEVKLTPQFRLLSDLQSQREEVRKEVAGEEANQPAGVAAKEPTPSVFEPGFFHYQTGIETDFSQIGLSDLDVGYFGPLLYGNFDLDLRVSDFKLKDVGFDLTYSDLWANNKTNQLINNRQTRKLASEAKLEELFSGKQLVLGDDFLHQPELLSRSQEIRGFTISSSDKKHEYGTTSITGKVPEGSDVELHSQGVLIDYQKAEDGIYNFNQVEVNGRYNTYEVVVYTPNGRIYSREKQVSGWSAQLPAGKIDYEAGLGKSEEGLIGNTNIYYGLNQDVSLGGELAAIAADEDKQQLYLGSKLSYRDTLNRTYFLNSYLPTEFTGAAYQGGLNQIFSQWVLEARLEGYSNIDPPERRKEGIEGQVYKLDQSSDLRLKTKQGNYSLQLNYKLNRFANYYEHNIGFDYRNAVENVSLLEDEILFRIKNNFSSRLDNPWINELRGEVYYSGWENINSRFYSQVGFNFNELKRYQLGTRISMQETWAENLDTSVDLAVSNGELYSWVRSEYQLSARSSISGRADNNSIQIKFNFREQRRAQPPFERVKEDVSSHRGLISGRVVRKFNTGEQKPVSGVEVKVGDRSRTETDEQGRYIISNLKPHKPVKLSVAPASLDALYAPEQSEVWVKPYPGQEVTVDFKIVPISGISGYIKGLNKLPQVKPKEIEVVLKNKAGKRVKEVTPKFDGFYIIEKVKPGDYKLTLELPAEVTSEVKLPLKQISIPATKDPQWQNGQNLTLE